MKSKISLRLLFCLAGIFIVMGCQGNPIVPAPVEDMTSPVIATESNFQSHQFLGFYGLVVDKQTPSVELISLRSAEIHLNVTGIFNAFNSVGIVFHSEL